MPRERSHAPEASEPEGRVAQDVMAFGQEFGRVLSDGRIVGRAEPFAKVFPSSRAVKRAVGVVAWAILEDIALDARLDERGQLIAETNVRRIAENLGLNAETVTRHLKALREYGFVELLRFRDPQSGRWAQFRYQIQPSACIERFTLTPSQKTRSAPLSENPYTVNPSTGEPEHKEQEEPARQPQQDTRASAELRAGFERLGVAGDVAAALVARYPEARVRDALEAAGAASIRNPAAWVVAALREDWNLDARLAERRHAVASATQRAEADQAAIDARAEAARQARLSARWAAALSAALDDRQLAEAVHRLTRPLPGIGRRSGPEVCAALVRWAQQVHAEQPDRPLSEALAAALAARPTPDDVPDGVLDLSAPQPSHPAPALAGRVGACLDRPARDRASAAPGLSR